MQEELKEGYEWHFGGYDENGEICLFQIPSDKIIYGAKDIKDTDYSDGEKTLAKMLLQAKKELCKSETTTTIEIKQQKT